MIKKSILKRIFCSVIIVIVCIGVYLILWYHTWTISCTNILYTHQETQDICRDEFKEWFLRSIDIESKGGICRICAPIENSFSYKESMVWLELLRNVDCESRKPADHDMNLLVLYMNNIWGFTVNEIILAYQYSTQDLYLITHDESYQLSNYEEFIAYTRNILKLSVHNGIHKGYGIFWYDSFFSLTTYEEEEYRYSDFKNTFPTHIENKESVFALAVAEMEEQSHNMCWPADAIRFHSYNDTSANVFYDQISGNYRVVITGYKKMDTYDAVKEYVFEVYIDASGRTKMIHWWM